MKKIFLFCLIFTSYAGFSAQVTDFSLEGAVQTGMAAGAAVWKNADGTIITVYADRMVAVFTDKSVITKWNDGRREVISPDGKKITVNDAQGTREYNSGTDTIVITFIGKTPFGEDIPRVEKKVMQTPLVRMIYIPEKSDEMLYPYESGEPVPWEIKDFFNGLYDLLRQKFINAANAGTPYTGDPFDLNISFCNYSKTGYCFGRETLCVVEVVRKGNIEKTFSIPKSDLRNKEERTKRIAEIAEAVVGR